MEMEFNSAMVKHEQLSDFARAIAGAYVMHHLPLRVLGQVLYDLVKKEEVELAQLLYDATATMASTTKLGSATMSAASLEIKKVQQRKRKRHAGSRAGRCRGYVQEHAATPILCAMPCAP